MTYFTEENFGHCRKLALLQVISVGIGDLRYYRRLVSPEMPCMNISASYHYLYHVSSQANCITAGNLRYCRRLVALNLSCAATETLSHYEYLESLQSLFAT